MTPPSKPRCDNCWSWSDRCTRIVNGQVRALCLSQRSYQSGCFTAPSSSCAAHRRGQPIDIPANKDTAE